jgi:hypothetical protein
MAGNQLGKTLSGAAEASIHLTGRYPDWWDGKTFDGPVRAMAGSESSELTRDGVQRQTRAPNERTEAIGFHVGQGPDHDEDA